MNLKAASASDMEEKLIFEAKDPKVGAVNVEIDGLTRKFSRPAMKTGNLGPLAEHGASVHGFADIPYNAVVLAPAKIYAFASVKQRIVKGDEEITVATESALQDFVMD